jgi:hypothetical protein
MYKRTKEIKINHFLLLLMILSLIACGSVGGGGGGGGAAAVPDYTTSFVINETSEINATLTGSVPNYVATGTPLTLATGMTVWSFTWAQYTTKFYAVDAANAQLLLNGSPFRGYPLAPAGTIGINFVTLPAGTWYVGVVPNQTITSTYNNQIYAELDAIYLPSWVENGNVTSIPTRNAGGWVGQPFTIPSGNYREFIETEGSGGIFAVMDATQYTSFTSTYANGYNGGAYSFMYACGPNSGGAALEIECEMHLSPGNYALVYINNVSGTLGGAANIQFYTPQ